MAPGLPGRHASAPEFADEPQAASDQGLSGDQEPAGDQEPGGRGGQPAEAGQALAAARVPRFTDGIPGSGAAAGASTPATGASVDVIVPPAGSPAAQSRLPIFESVESDWFRRSRRSSDAPEPGTPTEAPEPGTSTETPEPGAPTETWSSPADEGWRAAEVAQAPVSDGLTAAGLPQRVPKANLVPGRAGQADAATQPVSARSAAQTQARLASFQRAVREARAAAQADDAEQGEEGSDQAD
jgi:hypothetical protein